MSDEDIGFQAIRPADHELLVVDDDPASRYVTTRLLRLAGFRTREAATGAEGLALADSGISAIVLDVHLPDIDGFALCRRMRARAETARLPILHLSAAYVTDDDKVRGLASGADAYLTHPVEPAVLVATVQALVRTRVAEEAMRRSEARFKAIYVGAPGGICLLDPEGRFRDANPVMLGFLGRPLDRVIGQPLEDFVPAEWVERARAYARQLPPAEPRLEFPIVDAAGRALPLEWNISSLAGADANLALATDMSQRAALEQQRQDALERERAARATAEHLSRMKDEFIAVLSHELRSPLNAISAWTYLLQKRGAGDAEVQRGLSAIDRNIKQQSRLITDLLDMSRINLGKLDLVLEPVDVPRAIEAAVAALGAAAGQNANRIVVGADEHLPAVRADAGRVQQIVWNLLSNAIKFSPHGGEIRIDARLENAGVRVYVSDSGPGIAPEFAPHLFDSSPGRHLREPPARRSRPRAFDRAPAGRTAGRNGRGAQRRDRPRRHLRLLAAAGYRRRCRRGGAGHAARPGRHLRGLQLLIVDDDPEASALLQIILGDLGALVSVAYSAESALEQLRARPADALICDIGMPGKDGYWLINEIRRTEAPGTRLPAIALTAFSREQDRMEARTAGFDLHCAKPVQAPVLIQQLEQLAGRRRSEHGDE